MSQQGESNSYQGIEKYVRELEALYRISQVLASGTHQRPMLTEVLDVLHSQLGMTRGTIMLLSPDSDQLMSEVAQNLSREEMLRTRPAQKAFQDLPDVLGYLTRVARVRRFVIAQSLVLPVVLRQTIVVHVPPRDR